MTAPDPQRAIPLAYRTPARRAWPAWFSRDKLAETLIGEIVKAPVVEKCDRESRPQCRFEIEAKST